MNENKAVEELVNLYNVSFKRLTKKIINKKLKGVDFENDAEMLTLLGKELKKLKSYNTAFADQVITNVYGRTVDETMDFFRKHDIIKDVDPKWRSIHDDAILELQKSLTDELDGALIQVGRKTKDTLRDMTFEVSKLQTAGALDKQEAIVEGIGQLLQNGIGEVVYKNGARVSLESYVKMATRTTIDASINVATMNQQIQFENDLIKMSWHSTSCPICAPYQGRVYSISGKSTEYPSIDTINDGAFRSYGTIHPNCQHRALPYIPELDDNMEQTKKESNYPFEDNRTDYSKTRYKERQKVNAYNNEIKKLQLQNEVYKADGRKDLVKKNNEKIKRREKQVEEIKQWEIDTLKENQLFN